MSVSLQLVIENTLELYNLDPAKLRPEMVTILMGNGKRITGPDKPTYADSRSGVKKIWINHPDGEDLVEITVG